MAMTSEDIVQALSNRFSRLQSGRGTWEGHWEEVAATVWPDYSTSFFARGNQITQGAKRTQKMYDATAALALPKFAAAMESMLTPRTSKWHRLVPTDKDLLRDRNVRLWFEDVTDILFAYRYAPTANFADQQHQGYMQLGAFGTAAKFIDALDGGVGLRYRSCPLGEVYFLENHQGTVDTVYRRVPLTVRQAAQKWGEAKLPDQLKGLLKTSPDQVYQFLHCVKPRTEAEGYDPKRVDAKGMTFVSYYISLQTNTLMSEGGYRKFPYAVSRYVTAPGEVYGRSPAMLVLPNIKTLNEKTKTMLKQGHRAVDPVLLAHDDGVIDSFSLKPGAINYGGVTADGRPLVHALPTGQVSFFKELMEPDRESIKDAFLLTLFMILVESPEMTATEVLERAKEKGVLLSPTMGRQHTEDLGPTIEREIDLLMQQGKIPPMPQRLIDAGGEYSVRYESPMSRMARAEEAAGFFRTLELGIQIATATQNPGALDWADVDTAMPEVADINAVPVRWVRSLEQIKAIRENRQQQAATQQLIDAAPAAASVIKSIGGNKGAGAP